MNELPFKISSHKRSGTHLLAATLWENFDLPDTSLNAIVHAGKSFVYKKQRHPVGSRIVIPWGKLWGSHNFFNPRWFPNPEKILYIVRHPMHTLMSYWRFMDPLAEKDVRLYLGEDRVRFWYRHAKGYTSSCYYVNYEDIVGPDHKKTLDGIAEAFGLRAKRKRYKKVTEKIGWYPAHEPVEREKLSLEIIDGFRKNIPEGFLGYSFDPNDDYHVL